MRLNRFLAQAGVASRRKADDIIAAGRVSVNGDVVTEFSTRVGNTDEVLVDGARVELPSEAIIIALNKPPGVTTTLEDKHAERTVVDLLPRDFPRLVPVGRLDKDSEGLLLMTNDGDLVNELTHPSFEHEKEYHVTCEKSVSDEVLQQLRGGIDLEEGSTGLVAVARMDARSFSIVLTQGWKRQIRRMVEAAGNRVTLLRRVRIGKLHLDDLEPGKHRRVARNEIF